MTSEEAGGSSRQRESILRPSNRTEEGKPSTAVNGTKHRLSCFFIRAFLGPAPLSPLEPAFRLADLREGGRPTRPTLQDLLLLLERAVGPEELLDLPQRVGQDRL